jgi:hypothetical protein
MDEQDDARHETYAAYMLRLWQSGSQGGRPLWRASLEEPATGERFVFGDLSALFAFLGERTRSIAESSETSRRHDAIQSGDA